MTRTALLVAATCVLTACGDDPSSPPVSLVVLTAPKQTIAVGEPVQLTATALDASGNTIGGARFTYSSSSSAIASVNASGRVIGIAPGLASITATSGGRESVAVTLTVTTGTIAAVFTMQLNSFTPAQATIRVGQTVLYDFPAGEPHNVIFAQRTGKPADIPATSNLAVTRTFNTAGTFPFDCNLHPGMSGQVIVNP
jgi:plastocyanin